MRITVPFHNRDLKRKTLSRIIGQSGLLPEEFRRLLWQRSEIESEELLSEVDSRRACGPFFPT